MKPGEIISKNIKIELNAGAEITALKVVNLGDRPIQVGSHFHFFETNKLLQFPRRQAFAKRLNIPSGTAVRFEPGEEKSIELIRYRGAQKIVGVDGLVHGVTDEANLMLALQKIRARQFANSDED